MWRGYIRRTVERLTGTRILRGIPRGVDVVHDLGREGMLSSEAVRTVFDVGANVGQSCHVFLRDFARARILCFEPIAETFRALSMNVEHQSRVECHRIALSQTAGTATMLLEGSSDLFRLATGPIGDVRVESVEVDTLDSFCKRRGITHIDYLKIDTEGHDLEVLRGATEMLSDGRIAVVQVEAAMTALNHRHVPFAQLLGFLESYEYFLFGLYDQCPEWEPLPPVLRRTNSVFVGPSLHRVSRHTV